MSKSIDTMSVNAIRVLAADAIQKAKSGHPGLPLGSAATAYELWAKHMKHNPKNPDWANRDRFILSGGHGSTLLYSLLHLFGYGLTKEDMMQFRQDGSLTPGHPEYRHTKGVEATTGPLGAGMGMAVGMAMAEAHLAAKFNKEGYPVVDHYTYVLGGDGCMMEGVTYEAMSLAGTLGLNKLIVFYDSNKISIDKNRINDILDILKPCLMGLSRKNDSLHPVVPVLHFLGAAIPRPSLAPSTVFPILKQWTWMSGILI